MKVEKKFLFVFFALAIIVSTLAGVSATPGNLTITGNVTTNYDEGVFYVNWTTLEADGAVNYTIFVFANYSTYSKIFNVTVNNTVIGSSLNGTSGGGFTFTNKTEANYTFIIRSANATGMYNSSNISIYVDRTAPAITMPAYTNATAKKNSALLTLNISVIDASSGTTGSVCLVDVNGTSNQTIAFSGGWCNSSVVNLSGTSDGNSSIKVYVNDTVGMLGLNNSFAVFVDTTVPGASASCSPTSVHTGDSITCSCSGTDSGSGVSSETGGTTSTSNTGSYSYGCTVLDRASNEASASVTYVVEQSTSGNTGGSGGSSSTTTFTYSTTIPKNAQEMSEVGTIETSEFSGGGLGEKERVKIKLSGEEHYVGVRDISGSTVTVEITSNPIQEDFEVGEEKSFDLDDDGYYDLYIKMNEIVSNKADITIMYVHEAVSTQEDGETTSDTESGTTGSNENVPKESNTWIWIVVSVAVILGIMVFLAVRKKKRG